MPWPIASNRFAVGLFPEGRGICIHDIKSSGQKLFLVYEAVWKCYFASTVPSFDNQDDIPTYQLLFLTEEWIDELLRTKMFDSETEAVCEPCDSRAEQFGNRDFFGYFSSEEK
jgi:hypothetical protein